MANIYDMSDTWNDGATTFTSIKMNVTDTASASASLLMDLQVGAISQLKVSKAGSIFSLGGVNLGQSSGLAGPGQIFLYSALNVAPALLMQNGGGVLRLASGGSLQFHSGTNVLSGSPDLFLARDAANTLAQRNSTNAQTFNIYNTYTDASNYERGFMKWNSNVLEIGAEALGTGVSRSVTIKTQGALVISGPTGTNEGINTQALIYAGAGYRIGNNGYIYFSNGADYARGFSKSAGGGVAVTNGSTGGQSLEFREMTAPSAPAANGVYIYAEDDGAGKTRLMALFATGAAQQIAIEP